LYRKRTVSTNKEKPMKNKVFDRLVEVYKSTPIEFPALKGVTLAQWLHESGYLREQGISDLAYRHFNFAGLKARKEITKQPWASSVNYTAHDGPDSYLRFVDLEAFIEGYWAFLARSPYDGWRKYSKDPVGFMNFIGKTYCPLPGYAEKVLDLRGPADVLLGGTSVQDAGLTRFKGVLLEIGHGHGDPGARAHGISEHSLNVISANAAKEYLESVGINAETTDADGSLWQIGQLAKGYDCFVSIHHNAYNDKVQGCEAFYREGRAEREDIELASLIADELSFNLKMPDRGGRAGRLGVLSGAEAAEHYSDVQASVLAEIYFMDSVQTGHEDLSRRGGVAVGKAIHKWLKANR
jgi:N-acetylmuramoyl-L-alanine amidase